MTHAGVHIMRAEMLVSRGEARRRGVWWLLVCLVLLGPTPMARAGSYMYVRQGHPLVYRPGTSEPDPQWNQLGYIPNAEWTSSATGFGIGYGDGDDDTLLTDMMDNYMSIYVRSTFHVSSELAGLTHLEFIACFDDGFVAYLNGVEIARSHLPFGHVSFDIDAENHEADVGDEVYTLDPGLLVSGENVFAVQVHNSTLGSSDLTFIPTLWAYDTQSIDADIIRGPYLQQLGRREVLVVWETDLPAPSIVAYGFDESCTETIEDPVEKTRHEVVLSGLLPGYPTYYRVMSVRWPPPVGQIRAETDAATPYRFIVYGDTRANHDDHATVVHAMVPEAPSFLVHTGDLVSDGTNNVDWAWFFNIEARLLRNAPLNPVLGDDEADGVRYLQYFVLPEPVAGVENYYFFTYATSAFLMLDVNLSGYDPGASQYTWLETTLQGLADDPQIKLRFVGLHHGPYDSGPHGSNLSVRADLVPLFETYGVDAVFSGHDHTYERGTVNDIKYIVTGGGGASLDTATGDYWTDYTESEHHYVLVEVDGPRAAFTAMRTDGTVMDQFVIGDDWSECTTPDDCSAQSPGECLSDEVGAWACVHQACLWNCTYDGVLPDGGLPGPDSGVNPDGGIDPDATTEPPSGDDGCGCRQTGGAPGSALLGLLFAMLLVIRRQRFSRRD